MYDNQSLKPEADKETVFKNKQNYGLVFLLANIVIMLTGTLPLLILLWIAGGLWAVGGAMNLQKANHDAEIKKLETKLANRETQDAEAKAEQEDFEQFESEYEYLEKET